MLNENKKLNKALNENIQDLENARLKIIRYDRAISEQKSAEVRIMEIESRLRHTLAETEQWKQKYYELEGERSHVERVKRGAQHDKEVMENELLKYKDLYEQRSKEIEELKKIFSILEQKSRDSNRVITKNNPYLKILIPFLFAYLMAILVLKICGS